MSTKLSEEQALEQILFDIEESKRLRTLTDRQVVEEYLVFGSDVAIEEMMSRLWADWAAHDVGH